MSAHIRDMGWMWGFEHVLVQPTLSSTVDPWHVHSTIIWWRQRVLLASMTPCCSAADTCAAGVDASMLLCCGRMCCWCS